jgi:hypothetical protein
MPMPTPTAHLLSIWAQPSTTTTNFGSIGETTTFRPEPQPHQDLKPRGGQSEAFAAETMADVATATATAPGATAAGAGVAVADGHDRTIRRPAQFV